MYRPKWFREDRSEVLHQTIREIGAGAVVGNGPDGLVATHVPIELDPDPAPLGTLRCHFARPNPHATAIETGDEVLVIFQGPQGYVSPTWFPTTRETGKMVPTWNYVVVHAYGRPATFEGVERLRSHLSALTKQFEDELPEPWTIDDAPADFIDGLCQGIVGIEIQISRLEGKWKLSQNHPAEDQMGIAEGLKGRSGDAHNQLAALINRKS